MTDEKDRKPNFVHDCDVCISLGVFEYGDQSFDLYYHPNPKETVIARWSDLGEDYMSGLVFRFSSLPLSEAFRRAKERGLTQ